MKILSALGEALFDVPAQLVLEWIVAHHKRSAEIRFPFFEYRPQVEKDDVVFRTDQIGRISSYGASVLRPARTMRLCQ